MRIVVNGQPFQVESIHVSYDEIVTLVGARGTPSVTYCSKLDGDTRRQGTMYPGGPSVLLTDVMEFSVMHTGGA